MRPLGISIALLALLVTACSKPASSKPQIQAAPPAPPIANLPLTLKVQQRTTTPIAGATKKLSLTVDDITRGQVIASLVQDEGGVIFGPKSMKQGDSAAFTLDHRDLTLSLTELTNSLIGDDFATFVISDSKTQQLTELQKIERLITAVQSLTGAVFIRNGVEHTPTDAAAHLRTKLEASGGAITTASDFIDRLASQSSTSGKPYEIRYPDGRTVPAADFLRSELAKLDAQVEATERR
jgi:hypothetical protein